MLSNTRCKHALNHRVNFNDAKIICKNNNISKRRVIEGAIIHSVDTFPGNKAFSQEDYFTSKFICKEAKIKLDIVRDIAPNVAQHLSSAIHSHSQTSGDNPDIIHRPAVRIDNQQGPHHNNRQPDFLNPDIIQQPIADQRHEERINIQQGPHHNNRPPDLGLRRSRRIRHMDPE